MRVRAYEGIKSDRREKMEKTEGVNKIPDITMCIGAGYPMKENCYWYIVISNRFQSYFIEIFYKLGKCEQFGKIERWKQGAKIMLTIEEKDRYLQIKEEHQKQIELNILEIERLKKENENLTNSIMDINYIVSK